jgi:hypothetical protein
MMLQSQDPAAPVMGHTQFTTSMIALSAYKNASEKLAETIAARGPDDPEVKAWAKELTNLGPGADAAFTALTTSRWPV